MTDEQSRKLREVVDQTASGSPVDFEPGILNALLDSCDIKRDDDTCLAGHIRILIYDQIVLVQEQTQEGQLLLRRSGSLESAQRFVDDRLATYERMWDGCGCKIDYSS